MKFMSTNKQRFSTLAKHALTLLPLIGTVLSFAGSPLAVAADNEICPTQGTIKYACYAAKTTLNQVTILETVSVSGAYLQGTIQNHGWIANSVIKSGATLTGGILTGYITNEGTIVDIEFRGGWLKGGTLGGTIINNSRVRGGLVDVHLAPNAYVRGGEMRGQIKGDPQAPALLENVTIRKDSQLSGVIFGQNVIVEAGVTVETNVVDQERERLPELGNAIATTATGEALTVNSYFWGGSSIADGQFMSSIQQKLTDHIKVSGSITVAPEHVSQTAELIVYAVYQPQTFPIKIRFMFNSEGKTVGWKGDMAKLEAFKENVSLEATQWVEIYEGRLDKLVDAAGTVEIYFGYRLSDGTIATSDTPIKIIATK